MSSQTERALRVGIALLGTMSVFFAPAWIPVCVIILLSLRFRAWEALLIGLLIDFMWEPSGGVLHSLPFFMIAAIVIVWLFEPMRSRFLIQ